ncbi:MAG: TPM domain-containing protein [Vicinamibacterales bacterium]|nr:TPM domain-containing protein [Vicinamibacterales bacterium]
MTRVVLALAILFLPLTAAARADEVPIPPVPARWATDTAGFTSPQALLAADRMLEEFERATGNQILLWIGRTTGDTPLEDWTVKAFERWKVGRQGLDNGVVLFVFADDRKVRIEVGYGLEEKIPDGLGSRILDQEILPRIRAGDHDGAVLAGINALQGAIVPGQGAAPSPLVPGADAAPDDDAEQRPASRIKSVFEMVILGVLVIGFLILLVTNPSLALYLLFSILSSGGSGGGGRGGGGGFSGGGGRSGGGGASGSW